jgi:4-amino-4-deoxy-L-arabinose transferase-like glycosyltransferase
MMAAAQRARALDAARQVAVARPSWVADANGLAVGSFLLSLALGAYLNLWLGDLNGDAISRVANAYYVLFSRDPHLAAMGFVWNPLPSMLELPLVAMKGIAPALVRDGLASVVMSAAFAAVGAWYLVHLAAQLGLPRWSRLLVALLYQLNPMILMYSANGMTDVPLVTCGIAVVALVHEYLREERLSSLVLAALWLAAAFLIRYEAVALGSLAALGLIVAKVLERRPRQEIESLILVFLLPIVYAGFLWMFFNWLIMKNPIYFFTSSYGNASQTISGGSVDRALQLAHHSLYYTISYAAHMAVLFWPSIPLLVVSAIWWAGSKPRDRRYPLLVLAAFSVVMFQTAFVYVGLLAEWVRYWIAYIPAGFLVALWLAGRQARPKTLALVAILAVLALGNAGTFLALETSAFSAGNGEPIASVLKGVRQHPFAYADSVDAYLARHPHWTVLVDTFTASSLVLRAVRPTQFVISSDRDFHAVLANPRGRVSALLVPQPVGIARLDAINRAYPRLWAHGLPWARLVKTFRGNENYRLYWVEPTAP